MKYFFRREHEEPAVPGTDAIRDARHMLPSSARSPEAQRLNLFDPDEELDEDNDEDLAFLTSLISDGPPAAPARPPAPGDQPRHAASDETPDGLDVFREIAALRQRTELARQLRVDNVEMGDLLEDLHTMRAALLHRRRAA